MRIFQEGNPPGREPQPDMQPLTGAEITRRLNKLHPERKKPVELPSTGYDWPKDSGHGEEERDGHKTGK